MLNAFSWAKNTARGVRFLLGFSMYLFLAQCEQVYLFLVLAQKENVQQAVLVAGKTKEQKKKRGKKKEKITSQKARKQTISEGFRNQ